MATATRLARALLLLGLGLAALTPAVAAAGQDATQDRGPVAARALPNCALHPSPDCHLFGITELGFAVGSRTTEETDLSSLVIQATAAGGVMRNLTPHDAVGGFWFLAVGSDGVSTGPGTRYRRWFTPRQSVDVGVAVAVGGTAKFEAGSLAGHLRYNPTATVGLVVRPEFVRQTLWTCTTASCSTRSASTVRLKAGVDVSGAQGAKGAAAVAAGFGAMLLLYYAGAGR